MAEGGSDFTFIPSQRNKNKLAYSGFIYICDRKNGKKVIGKKTQKDLLDRFNIRRTSCEWQLFTIP